jgi:hypothetical protein
MGTIHVKNGTPVGNQHLCKSCAWGQYTTGYRESELLVFCTNSNPTFRVPFRVHECSEYSDRHKPDWDEMEKLAIKIQPLRMSKKMRGFAAGTVITPEMPKPEVAKDEDDSDSECVNDSECVKAVCDCTDEEGEDTEEE